MSRTSNAFKNLGKGLVNVGKGIISIFPSIFHDISEEVQIFNEFRASRKASKPSKKPSKKSSTRTRKSK
jgi:hypothetical protein